MNLRERLGALALFLLGAAAFLIAGEYSFDAQIFPRLICVVMMICAIGLGLRSLSPERVAAKLKESEASPDYPVDEEGPPRILYAGLVLVVAYVAGVRWLGFATATTIFIPATALAFGLRDWKWIVFGTAVFVGLTTYLFVYVFRTPLPRELPLVLLGLG
ncbi:MAG TPA: tripartite tricarboxylate transporter TctB family protein [Devosia sp.]|nr:tripartite tricarboxylate transporter TctB family protein [Devosia sp.]